MNELALRDPAAVALRHPDAIIQRSGGIWERDIIDGWIEVLEDVSKLANFIAETDFVPRALRNRPAAVAACILTGRELGIGPMQSLKAIHMVQGVPSLSAEYKRARALAAGHEIVFDDTTGTRCVIRGRRANSDRWVTVQWNMDMARRAKLDGKDVWRQYPQRMLQARASSELCDILFPDASLGLATMEVLEDGGIVTESGETVDAATGEITSGPAAIEQPKPRTAARKPRTQTAPPAQPSSPVAAPAATPPSAADAGGALPPLPGEEEDRPTGAPDAGAPASTGARAPADNARPRSARGSAAEGESTSRSSATASAAGAGSPGETDDPPGADKHRALVGIVQQHFTRLGFGDGRREERLAKAAQIAQVPALLTLNDLGSQALSALADTLARCKNEDALDALLNAAAPPGDRPPARISSGQLSQLRTHYERLGYAHSEEDLLSWLGCLARLAGLPELKSMQNLDQDQAARVIAQLKPLKNGQELVWLLEDGHAAQDSAGGEVRGE